MDSTRGETKYERLRKIGIGSYGVVFKCVNRQTGQIVAIKRYSENDADPIIRKIAMREVRMLRQLKHPNLINLIEVFRRKRILHLVFDYCELTVLDVIEKYANNCPLNLIKKIIWQLVNGVSHCHAHNCVHRDIKPENILINQSGVVKLCDFGFARNMNPPSNRSIVAPATTTTTAGAPSNSMNSAKQVRYEREAHLLGVSTSQMSQFMLATAAAAAANNNSNSNNQSEQQKLFEQNKENQHTERLALTEYVATRWYRAPELLVGDVYYDKKIDIWAIGCVTAELMRGEPVWPGKTDLDQLFMIKNSLGPLTAGQTHTLLTQALYNQANLGRLLNQSSPTDPLERKLPHRIGQAGQEFVLDCLQMDPTRRPACDQLLQHSYIQSAQMTQFVRGASHVTATSVVQSEQLAFAPRSATKWSHHSLLGSSSEARELEQQAANGARSNSQAILMMANTHQPASKRLLMAPDSSGATRPTSHKRERQDQKVGSLVPVSVRSRNSGISANPAHANWLQQADDSMQQQHRAVVHQYKRKVPAAADDRSVAVIRQAGEQSRRQTTKASHTKTPLKLHRDLLAAGSGRNEAATRSRTYLGSSFGEVNSNGSHRDSLGSLHSGSQKVGRSRGSRRLEMHEDEKERSSRSNGPARRDRQQTNLGHHRRHITTSEKMDRVHMPSGILAGTNSPSSSSSRNSIGTNKSSSTSFLPSIRR